MSILHRVDWPRGRRARSRAELPAIPAILVVVMLMLLVWPVQAAETEWIRHYKDGLLNSETLAHSDTSSSAYIRTFDCKNWAWEKVAHEGWGDSVTSTDIVDSSGIDTVFWQYRVVYTDMDSTWTSWATFDTSTMEIFGGASSAHDWKALPTLPMIPEYLQTRGVTKDDCGRVKLHDRLWRAGPKGIGS